MFLILLLTCTVDMQIAHMQETVPEEHDTLLEDENIQDLGYSDSSISKICHVTRYILPHRFASGCKH